MALNSDIQRRLALLKDWLKASALDGMLITNQANVSYLSAFTGHDAMMLVTCGKDYFITDSRYIQEAQEKLQGFCVKLVEISAFDTVSEIISMDSLKKVGFESMDLPYGVALRIDKLIKKIKAKIVPCKDIVEGMRSIKDAGEVLLIKESIRITKKIVREYCENLKPGESERSISMMIEAAFIHEGARPAFDPIVSSSENSSKPHAVPSEKKISNNSFVMIDVGAKFHEYCSDMTRMFLFGRVKEKFMKIHDIVRTAQQKAIEKIRPGVKIRDVDAAGREHISAKGFGRYFAHSLGHGIGLSVHEQPTISGSSDGIIKPGMVFTVEPAIYLPKFGGVRIEDMVLVTNTGCEVLTN